MIAIALITLSAALLGALITVLAWYRAALVRRDELDHERDLLVRERDGLSVTLSTVTDERDRERHLRELVEVQRNEATSRARRYLTERGLSNGEIAAAMDHVFSTPLGLLPPLAAHDPDADRDDLLSPWVQPAATARRD